MRDVTLTYFIRELQDRDIPLLLSLTYRESELKRHQKSFIKNITLETKLSLGPWGERDVHAWLEEKFGILFCVQNPIFIQRLYKKTSGNSLYATQSIERLKSEDYLFQDKNNEWQLSELEDFDWFENVEQSIANRIKGLNTDEQLLLTIIFCNSGDLTEIDYLALLEISKREFNKFKKSLKEREILYNNMQFSHPLLLEAVEIWLSTQEREDVFRNIFNYLCKIDGISSVRLAEYQDGFTPNGKREQNKAKKIYLDAVGNLGINRMFASKQIQWLERCRKYESNSDKQNNIELQLAKIQYHFGKYDKAENCFRNVLNQSNAPEKLRAIIGLLEVLSRQSRIGESKELLQTGMEIAQRNQDKKSEIALQVYQIYYYDNQNDSTKRDVILNDLKEREYSTKDLQIAQAKAFIKTSSFYARRGDWQTLKETSELALEVGEKYQDFLLIGDAFNHLSTVALSVGDIATGKSTIENALTSLKNIGSLSAIAEAKSNLGNVLIYSGKSKQAISYLKKSIRIFSKLGEKNKLSKPVINLGMAFMMTGDYLSANSHFKQYESVVKSNPYAYSYYLFLWGNTFTKMRKYKHAEKKLLQSLQISRKHKITTNTEQAYIYLAECFYYRPKPNYTRAYSYFESAYKIQPNKKPITIAMMLICSYYLNEIKNLNLWKFELEKHIAQLEQKTEKFKLILAYYTSNRTEDDIKQLLSESYQNDSVSLNHFYSALYIRERTNNYQTQEGAERISNHLLTSFLAYQREENRTIEEFKFTPLRHWKFPIPFSAGLSLKIEVLLSLLEEKIKLEEMKDINADIVPYLILYGNEIISGRNERLVEIIPDERKIAIVSTLIYQILSEFKKQKNKSLRVMTS